MSLYQLHHQSKIDRSDCVFIAQNDITKKNQFTTWFKDVNNRHPLPEGYEWLVCNEKSKYFVLTATDKALKKGGAE